MPCRLCVSNPVWKFTNQQQLCRACFSEYFQKKVRATIRKYQMPIRKISGNSVKSRVINKIIENLHERKGSLKEDNLNNLSNCILNALLHKNTKELSKLLPKNQPLYFLSNKEILLYSKINKIKGSLKEDKSDINAFIKSLEARNPDVRQNIVNALIKSDNQNGNRCI